MKQEKVINVIFNYFPDKIMVYLRNKLIFNDDIQSLKYNSYIENMNVYSYEYVNKEKNIMLIRVIED